MLYIRIFRYRFINIVFILKWGVPVRNIDKKWALFAMATAVSFYGIIYTLINTTFAISSFLASLCGVIFVPPNFLFS